MKIQLAALILALAVPSFTRADNKYAYVDVQKVLDTVEEGKTAKADFKKKIDAKKADLDKKNEEFKKLTEAYEKQKSILSAAASEEKKKELQTKGMELQKNQMEAQSEMANYEQQLSGPIFKKIKQVIEKVGRDGGYDFVWEKTEGGIIYAKPSFDLTDQVIAQYDKTYKK